jgi:hypothetical protein
MSRRAAPRPPAAAPGRLPNPPTLPSARRAPASVGQVRPRAANALRTPSPAKHALLDGRPGPRCLPHHRHDIKNPPTSIHSLSAHMFNCSRRRDPRLHGAEFWPRWTARLARCCMRRHRPTLISWPGRRLHAHRTCRPAPPVDDPHLTPSSSSAHTALPSATKSRASGSSPSFSGEPQADTADRGP